MFDFLKNTIWNTTSFLTNLTNTAKEKLSSIWSTVNPFDYSNVKKQVVAKFDEAEKDNNSRLNIINNQSRLNQKNDIEIDDIFKKEQQKWNVVKYLSWTSIVVDNWNVQYSIKRLPNWSLDSSVIWKSIKKVELKNKQQVNKD
jgi:hypothetical protein